MGNLQCKKIDGKRCDEYYEYMTMQEDKGEMMDKKDIKTTKLKEWMSLIEESLKNGKSVRFAPRGISMLPMLRQGIDCVVLSPLPEKLKKYDLPLYQRDDGKYILHRIVKVGETYTCIGDNQFELESGVRHDQMIAVVTGFTRGEKEHSVTELGYQLYCRVWHYSRPFRLVLRKVKGRVRRIVKKS